MNQAKTQAIVIANSIRDAVRMSNQAREIRKAEAAALRFVPEGAHLIDGQWYQVKRIKLISENHPDQKIPRFTKVIRKITAAKATQIGAAAVENV